MLDMTRVPRSKAAARETYNRLSPWYDLIAGASEAPSRRAGLELLGLRSGLRVLEIGCGTGHALVSMARAVGESGHCFGLDLAPGMARVALERATQDGVRGDVSVCVGDGAAPPYTTNVFDAIFMSFTLELFDTPEIPVVLQACRSILQPEGELCVVALSRSKINLAVRAYEWAHRRFPRWVDCRPIYLHQLLREAEYRIVATRRRTMWGLPVEIVLAEKGRASNPSLTGREAGTWMKHFES
jgi:ubiquinone/menaquinone biosynthesis C-methylase UbiE